ncbi:MAG: response regulator [Planctomycetota bacterium]
MANTLNENVPILLVEDDDDDVRLTQRALEKGQITNPLYVVKDGDEAIEFLEHQGRYTNPEDAPKPGIILLDLNMPRMNGKEVLKQIKKNESLRQIPVIILTTSELNSDIIQCYEEGANTFITKPVEFGDFLDAVITTGKYWLSIAKLSDSLEVGQ